MGKSKQKFLFDLEPGETVIFDGHEWWFAGVLDGKARLWPKEAYDMTREQVEKVWSPCNFCAGAKYITGTVTSVYPLSETRQYETLAEGDFDFCPVCGRPLTDEAVEMVRERMEALHGET